MYIDGESVADCKAQLKPIYDAVGSIPCRAIRSNVVFNAHGWRHLTRHSNGERRIKSDALMRLKLLQSAVDVVKRASTPHSSSIDTQTFSGVQVEVLYIELRHKFNKSKNVEVVLRKIGAQPIHYWTVRYV